ncbi:MAG: L-serine ammonia-lyase, iron-sulfur-dependent, subunit alpha [Bacteroidales bacterium]|nr:L-serine ammonia-lyase, iron-sulfur-dependent, subunit alpha [Bacteroidales bacterium]
MKNKIIALLKQEVKPALGCTEPIAVALAIAHSCEALKEIDISPSSFEVEVSANILKNGMGVGIPGTGMVGLYIASALGSICGKSEYGLEVLKDLTDNCVEQAKALLKNDSVKISIADAKEKLYICATAFGPGSNNTNHSASTIIKNNHDSIVSIVRDGKEIFSSNAACKAPSKNEDSTDSEYDLTNFSTELSIKDIYDFVMTVPFKDIEFIMESVTLNNALVEEGLKNKYGLQVGKTILSKENKSVFGDTILSYVIAHTAAASDARMAGCTLPAMSNSGSGNQGITVTVPVIAVAEKIGSSRESLARALTLSHLIAIHIKGYLGKLSALCGCVIASTGSACGIVYLKGGGYDQICYAIKNMIGNITGMVCDGAKVGCALKVASGASSAVQSAVLALDGISISENDGIIEKDIEKTISNLGKIGSIGMQTTDEMILNIMLCK